MLKTQSETLWGMGVGNNSPTASISASSTDLKRIQFPHVLLRDFLHSCKGWSAPKSQNNLSRNWFFLRSVEVAKIEDSSESIPTLILQTAALSHFPFLEFRQWRSLADTVLTLNLNHTILENLEFGLGHMLALRMCSDYSFCIASEQKFLKGLAIFFPWIVQNTAKAVAHTEGLTPYPPDWWETKAICLVLTNISKDFPTKYSRRFTLIKVLRVICLCKNSPC